MQKVTSFTFDFCTRELQCSVHPESVSCLNFPSFLGAISSFSKSPHGSPPALDSYLHHHHLTQSLLHAHWPASPPEPHASLTSAPAPTQKCVQRSLFPSASQAWLRPFLPIHSFRISGAPRRHLTGCPLLAQLYNASLSHRQSKTPVSLSCDKSVRPKLAARTVYF